MKECLNKSIRRFRYSTCSPYSTVMSFSGHSPPSTQAILSAQRTPSLASRRTVHRKRSIIIISSSPDLSIRSQSIQVLDSEDEQYFGPQRTAASPQSNPTRHRKSQNENSIEVVEDEEFTKLLAGFKYASSSSSAASCSVPRAPLATRKTNLDSYFQEVKPSSKAKRAGAKTTRLKPSLATRVNPLAKPPIPREKPEKQAVQTAHTSFFTSWAADQAPVIRPPKPSAKPRRKPVKKKDVDVVLLSPRTGQESVRRPPEDESVRKLGERSNGGMWDACKRGLEGELYDVDGEIVFSQELRDIQVEEVEIVGTGEGGESTEGGKQILCLQEEPPAQRKVKVVQVRDDGMPAYSSFTTQQLQVCTGGVVLIAERSQKIRIQGI